MDAKKWFFLFLVEISVLLFGTISMVIFVDPYFHYHKPKDNMFYTLSNQRSQNDGIIKNFDYDSIITGTSMTENFKSSEFGKIFHTKSIKVCFSGGTYKEINDNLKKAFDSGHEIKYILRCLDYMTIIKDKDAMRWELGEYPTYLYDKNPFNDVKYVLNKEIICNICIPMLGRAYLKRKEGGITSFDVYSNWNNKYTFGAESVLGDRIKYIKAEEDMSLTEAECETVKSNIQQNVTSLAQAHPETVFYYFFSPYSIAYWGELLENGTLNKQIEAEKIAIEEILKCENIKLYSFNNCWDITTNLDNYKDSNHYGEWINTEILYMIYNGIGRLTQDNYKQYLEAEQRFYSSYNYQFYDIVKEE